ncbi:MAG: hypothetical protein OEN01_00905 [Candidatus Krumholzibacteria bacterium]|nr:hypothetical protein [Candidatus Krumholzibacteria bacterium]
MRLFKCISIMVVLLVVAMGSASAATWYVTWDGSGDAPNLQAAIDSTALGDTVLVAPGTYTGTGNFEVDFRGKAIVVISESGASDTIIDCQGNGRAFIFQSGEGLNSVLCGFAITNGLTSGAGGAIFCDNSSPEICYNVIYGNHAGGHGGGIAVRKASPVIRNNTIAHNSTDRQGGGITFQSKSMPTISCNIIAFATLGEGVVCVGEPNSNPTMSCNNVFGNAGGDVLCGVDAGGNESVDPVFCGGLGSGNYYLQEDSPCQPIAAACGVLIGALGSGCSTVPTEQSTWGAIKARFE